MKTEPKSRPARNRAAHPALDRWRPSGAAVFTVRDVARIAAIPARSINFWTGPARVLTPDHAYRGRGSAKRFSLRNLVQLRVIALLAERGVSLAVIRALVARARHQRSRGHDWFRTPAPRAPGPALVQREFLTCAPPRRWRRWRFPVDTPGGLAWWDSGTSRRALKKTAGTRAAVFSAPWARHSTSSLRSPQSRDELPPLLGAFLGELLSGDDTVVVNLGQIKADLVATLGRRR